MCPFVHCSRLLWFAATAALLANASTAAACPFCKEALGAGGGDLVNGFFYSILFMLSMPFLILGGISGYLYLLVRRARAARHADAASATQHALGSSKIEEPAGV